MLSACAAFAGRRPLRRRRAPSACRLRRQAPPPLREGGRVAEGVWRRAGGKSLVLYPSLPGRGPPGSAGWLGRVPTVDTVTVVACDEPRTCHRRRGGHSGYPPPALPKPAPRRRRVQLGSERGASATPTPPSKGGVVRPAPPFETGSISGPSGPRAVPLLVARRRDLALVCAPSVCVFSRRPSGGECQGEVVAAGSPWFSIRQTSDAAVDVLVGPPSPGSNPVPWRLGQ
jgi:hypothetical protein